ncbi:MAG: MMPL family transporter [Pseudomonadota bacterium]|nr:MMPL family transporter [Pseudomonadota bacterium]
MAAWVAAVCRAPVWVLIGAAALAALSAHYAARNLGVNTDTADLLSPDLPFLIAQRRFERLFPDYDDTLLLVLEADTPERAREAADRLASRVERESTLYESVFRPRGGDFFARNGLLFYGPEELASLADQLTEAQPLLARLSADMSLDGLFAVLAEAVESLESDRQGELTPILDGLGRAVAAQRGGQPYRLSWEQVMRGETPKSDANREFLIVKPRLDYGRLGARAPAVERLRELGAELGFDGHSGVHLRVTGEVALAYDELRTVIRGMEVVGVLALLLVSGLLYMGLGSARLAVVTLITLLVGLSLTAAFAAITVGRLNLISIAFVVLYVGLGVDYAIHFILRFEELRSGGADPARALRGTTLDLSGAFALCAVTTAIGFYAFVPTAYAGVSELGLIAGTSMFISLLSSLTVLPALLCLVPGTAREAKRSRETPWIFSALLDVPLHHRRRVRLGTLLVTAAALACIPEMGFDRNPLNLRDPASESVAALNALFAEKDNGYWNIVALAEDADAAQALAERLAALAPVDKAITVFDLVPGQQEEKLAIIEDLAFVLGPGLDPGQIRKQEHAPDETLAAMEGLREAFDARLAEGNAEPAFSTSLASATAALEDMHRRSMTAPPAERRRALESLESSLLSTLPSSLRSLNQALQAETVSRERLPRELAGRWVSPDGVYLVQVLARGDLTDPQTLARFVSAVRDLEPAATGPPVMNQGAGDAVVLAFKQALIWALVGIGAILLVVLRSVPWSLAVLAPLLLAGLLTGAGTVLFGIPFNFANIIAIPLLLGIGVDSGVHMVHRLRRGLPSGDHPLRTSTARAVFFSTLTTAAGFGNLALSPHPGTASMGELLTLGVLLTLVSTLLVLPALLPRRATCTSANPSARNTC